MQVGLLEMRTMMFVEVREYSGQYILQDNPWLYTQWVQRAACQVAAALHAFSYTACLANTQLCSHCCSNHPPLQDDPASDEEKEESPEERAAKAAAAAEAAAAAAQRAAANQRPLTERFPLKRQVSCTALPRRHQIFVKHASLPAAPRRVHVMCGSILSCGIIGSHLHQGGACA